MPNVQSIGFNFEFHRPQIKYNDKTRIVGDLHCWTSGLFLRNATTEEQIKQDKNPSDVILVGSKKCFVRNHIDF